MLIGVVDLTDRKAPADPRESAPEALADSRLRKAREVLCEPTRSHIIRALATGALTVGQLADLVGRKKWATSQQLRVLRESGFVEVERLGRRAYYRRASTPEVDRVVRAIDLLVGGPE